MQASILNESGKATIKLDAVLTSIRIANFVAPTNLW